MTESPDGVLVVRGLCRDIGDEVAKECARTGATVVGTKRLLRLSPHHRPSGTEKSPAPPVHCQDQGLRTWFIEAYKGFAEAYRAAYERLHGIATSGEFPCGGVPPTAAYGAHRS